MASERDNAPVRRQAHQSVEDMAAQMTAKKEKRSPKSRLYNEVSSELKAAALDTAIRQQQDLLKRSNANGRVDLNNLDEVRKSCEDYIESCRIAGIIPSVTGLAPSMGYSRQALTAYISHNNTPTAQYLDAVRSAMAAITEQAGLTRAASEAVSIFVLKNSAGMVDKLDVTATPGIPEEERELSIDEIAARYLNVSSEPGTTFYDDGTDV